jgi:hypothetical protein
MASHIFSIIEDSRNINNSNFDSEIPADSRIIDGDIFSYYILAINNILSTSGTQAKNSTKTCEYFFSDIQADSRSNVESGVFDTCFPAVHTRDSRNFKTLG